MQTKCQRLREFEKKMMNEIWNFARSQKKTKSISYRMCSRNGISLLSLCFIIKNVAISKSIAWNGVNEWVWVTSKQRCFSSDCYRFFFRFWRMWKDTISQFVTCLSARIIYNTLATERERQRRKNQRLQQQ